MSREEIQREIGDARREDICEYIAGFWAGHGYGPSVRDIMRGCGFSSTSSVAHHLSVLRDMGKIEYSDKIARSVRLT